MRLAVRLGPGAKGEGRQGKTETTKSLQHPRVFEVIRNSFAREKERYEEACRETGRTLEYAFDFMEAAFGNGQEMVLFITDLNASPVSLRYLKRYPCERYYYYNQELLIEDRSQALRREILEK